MNIMNRLLSLCLIGVIAFPTIIQATATDALISSAAKKAASITNRLVEVPRDQLLNNIAEDSNADGDAQGIINKLLVDSAGILPSTDRNVELGHPHHQPANVAAGEDNEGSSGRKLLIDIDATSSFQRQSSTHSKLSTPLEGDVPSSSIEFTVSNHHDDGEYVILSSLGLHVRIVTPTTTEDEAPPAEAEAPCRVKVYSKRLGSTTSPTINPEYFLALDVKLLCAGNGQETRLTSDVFLESYRQLMEEESTRAMVSEGLPLPYGLGGEDGGRRKRKLELTYTDTENIDHGTVIGSSNMNSTTATTTSSSSKSLTTDADDGGTPQGLTEQDKLYPLLIPPSETVAMYIAVLSPEDDAEEASDEAGATTSFLLVSSIGDDSKEAGELYLNDTTLNLYTGSSIIASSSTPTTLEEALQVTSPTIFNGIIYYDTFDATQVSLGDYYDGLVYALLPGDPLHGMPGCDKLVTTGYVDTVGSYGIMFDVTNAVLLPTTSEEADDDEDFTKKFKNIEIYNMDLYIRNIVNTNFEIHVRKHPTLDGKYTTYTESGGQTLIEENWNLIAKGTVPGQGPDVGSPIPSRFWKKNIVLEPGETIGFYVTVTGAPDLRYRNSTLAEGTVYTTDGILNVGVGRSWGEYPLRGDGTDVYFPQREFSGGFHYHVHEGLCESTSPSLAPSSLEIAGGDDMTPSSPSLTEEGDKTLTGNDTPGERVNSYQGSEAVDVEGLCADESTLETTFQDGTGSYGALFDVLAKSDMTLTGMDLNMDWNTDNSAHLLIYAREGSWFGHQNNAESWPLLLVNTTIHRPEGFHNRSENGPYIPIDSKRNSAIIPKSAFTPLRMKVGDTWSFYVCSSIADFRYTLGSSIGKTFASNSHLRVMEGSGAADYPPFMGGTPESGGVEYTFYAPRVFNGNLRYDFVSECESTAPSAVFVTPSPTPIPRLSTSVSYTFYIEHSADKLKGEVTYDMSFGVRDVLESYLGGKEDILYGYAVNHELAIEHISANMVSPTEIGYLCYPTPPDTCSPISVEVIVSHLSTVTQDEVTFELLRQSTTLPTLINVEGYNIEYVGDRAVETTSEITLSGVPDREMGSSEQLFFEEVARDFLRNTVDSDKHGNLKILSVTINGQEITSGEESDDSDSDTASVSSGMAVRDGANRRLQGSNSIQVSVKGKHRPPPKLNFGEVVESSINRDRELLKKELNKRPNTQGEEREGDELNESSTSDYFSKIDVVGARDVKEVKDQTMKTPTLGAPAPQNEEDNDMKSILNFAAMGVGGLIFVLSIAFLLRPHRRRVIFGSSNHVDNRAQRRTQQVDIENHGLLKSRAMVRGDLYDSGNSFPSTDSDKKAYNPRSSANSERMLAYSDFSSGQPAPFDDPYASGTSYNSSRRPSNRGRGNRLDSSGTSDRGRGNRLDSSGTSDRGRGNRLDSSGTRGNRGSFNGGQQRSPYSSFTGPPQRSPNSSFTGPPQHHPMGGSMPPMPMRAGGVPPPHRGSMNNSMPPSRSRTPSRDHRGAPLSGGEGGPRQPLQVQDPRLGR